MDVVLQRRTGVVVPATQNVSVSSLTIREKKTILSYFLILPERAGVPHRNGNWCYMGWDERSVLGCCQYNHQFAAKTNNF